MNIYILDTFFREKEKKKRKKKKGEFLAGTDVCVCCAVQEMILCYKKSTECEWCVCVGVCRCVCMKLCVCACVRVCV